MDINLAGKTGIADEDIRKFILYGEYFRDTDTQKTLRVQDEKTGKVHYEFDRSKRLEIPETIFNYKKNVNRLEEIDKLLENVKIADPAVGSGAFPLGMLNEIVKARQTLTEYMLLDMDPFRRRTFRSDRSPYWLKRAAIKNSIFACDIEPSAVDITRLRLWLSLVIDNQIGKEDDAEMGYSTRPMPLPNLDSNIICGNSLMDEFEGVKLLTENAVLGNQSDKSQYTLYDQTLGYMINDLIDLQSKLYDEKDNNEKESLKNQIQSIYDQIILEQLKGNPELIDKYYQAIQLPSKPFVLWQLYFPKVFRDNGGFDVVLDNPPYVDSEEMTRSMSKEREIYSNKFRSAKGNWDLFVLFIEKGIYLLKSNEVITFIVPNKLVSAPYSTSIRKLISENQVIEMRDYSEVNVFKSASVYPIVFRIRTTSLKIPVVMDVMDNIEHVSNHNVIEINAFYTDIEWDKFFRSSTFDLQIIDKMNQFEKLGKICRVNGAATVSEAYIVKEFIFDGSSNETESFKFINTGGIDPYTSFHGKAPMRYLKDSYTSPYVHCDNIKNMSIKRYEESISEKIIIGGMTKRLEAFYDSGNYYAAKSTTIVYGNSYLKYITAVINSKLMSFFYSIYYNSMSLAGGFFRIGAPQLKELPIACPRQKETLDRIESMVDEIQKLANENNINNLDELITEIDDLIFDIYGLNQEEILYLNNKINLYIDISNN